MKGTRDIAAAIDLRVRQLDVHRLSDSALVDHMVGYMAELERLWTSTTDEELASLCEQFPGLLRYATLMENVSAIMRSGVGVPAHIQSLSPFVEPLKQAVAKFLSDGAALERDFQQRIDDARAAQFRAKAIQDKWADTADLNDLYVKWCAAVRQFMADVGTPDVSDQGQPLLRRAFEDMASRIKCLRDSAASSAVRIP